MNKNRPGFLLSLGLLLHSPTYAKPPDSISLASGCSGCHGPHGDGNGSISSLRSLSNQSFRQKMMAFKNDGHGTAIMNRIVKAYSEQEIDELAHYFTRESSP